MAGELMMVERRGECTHLVPTPIHRDAIPDAVLALCGAELSTTDPAVRPVVEPDERPCLLCRDVIVAAANRAPQFRDDPTCPKRQPHD